MDKGEEELLRTLEDLFDIYDMADEVDTTLPVGKYIENTIRCLRGEIEIERIDIEDWMEDISEVAEETPTAELRDIFSDIDELSESQFSSSAFGVTVLSLCAVLIECRNKIAQTPLEDTVEELRQVTSSEGSNRWDSLRTAGHQTIDTVRRTEVVNIVLDRLEDIEFVHPDESHDEVSEAVQNAHLNQDNSTLQKLAYRTERSYRGEWKQVDLKNYDDEKKTGEPFEYLLADLWSDMGYETSLTAGGDDGGVDIIGTNDREEILIQAKRYDDRKVSATEIRELAGLFPQHEFDHALMVTSSSPSEPAEEEVSRIDNLEIVDGTELADLLSESALQPPVTIGDH